MFDSIFPGLRPGPPPSRVARRASQAPRNLGILPLTLLLAATVACTQPDDGAGPGAFAPTDIVAEPSTALRPEALRGPIPADARIADYELDARLDAEAHQVTGTARVTWRNTSSMSVDSLPFHLYMNGFRAEDTAWMQGGRGGHRGNEQADDSGAWGYIDVHSVQLEPSPDNRIGTETATQALSVPWAEGEDPSVMEVQLPRQVAPGEMVSLRLEFTTQLPQVYARTGYAGNFHAVAQWFPKIAVLEEGGWNNHIFTLHDEFFADFGNYRVTLDVPEEMIVGATGIRVDEAALEEGRRRLVYEAEMVHDFAWMADPDFVEHLGFYKDIRIRQLIHPDYKETAGAHLEAQRQALESYESRFGPYPWSTITIVHAPEDGEGAGGMEYPTLYTTSDQAKLPRWVRQNILDERVSGINTTVHEFGHQYFQGIFASREHLEPWLDEGINTMSNYLAFLDRYEDPWVLDLLGNRLHMPDALSLTQGWSAYRVPVANRASEFVKIPGSFGATSYSKTATIMLTLRNLVGHEAFDQAFRAYTDQARFRHPTGSDLQEVLIAELGEKVDVAPDGHAPVWLDLRDYFDQALNTVNRAAFTLVRVRNRPMGTGAGWHRDEEGALVGGEAPDDTKLADLEDSQVEGQVVVQRRGSFRLPLEIEIELADGSTELHVWDGQDGATSLVLENRRIQRVRLDPDKKLMLERDRIDNSRWARDVEDRDDGLSSPLATLGEAFALMLLGGVA